jgi:molybdopterin synthase catalytic subunit
MTAFAAAHPEAGGIVSFVGKVRPDRDVEDSSSSTTRR